MCRGRVSRRLCFDIETDGLLKELTTIHCMAAQDVDTGEAFFWDPSTISEGIAFIEQADLLIAHNGINFDLRAIQKVYPEFKPPKLYDTLLMAKMVWPSDILFDHDYREFKRGRMEWKFVKRYSLEAWGNRLGVHKGDFGKTADWSTYTPEMGEYNKQDVVVNVALWKKLEHRLGWDPARPPADGFTWSTKCVDLEMDVARIINEQEAQGFGFDRRQAILLAQRLANEQADLEDALVQHFGSWWEPLDDPEKGTTPTAPRREKMAWLPDVTRRRVSEKTGKELKPQVGPPLCEYSPDAPFVRIEWTTFNPSSRTHLGMRLMKDFGWKPEKFGGKAGDIPTVDEGTIKDIPEHVLPSNLRTTLLHYFVVAKTLAQLSKGKKSWLGLEEDGRLHGRMDTLGAITARATHSDPNLGQVPGVRLKETKDETGKVISKAPLLGIEGGFGWECRSLFTPRPTWEQTGTDASGLELRNLGHELEPFDGGAFASRVSDPTLDIHTENSKLTRLSRSDTKTTTYAFLYGAGPLKVGTGVGVKPEEVEELLASKELKSYLDWMRKKAREERKPFVEPDAHTRALIAKGSRVIASFQNGIAGLKDFRKAVSKAGEAGWLPGLDGRKVFVRKAHASVNTLLQSSGAIICKMWMVKVHEMLQAQGLMPRTDYNQMAWVHDELQFEHRPGLGDTIGKTSKAAIAAVAAELGYKSALAAEYKTGRSWAECH